MTEIARTNPPAHVRAVMDATDRAELDRLRARVAELEAAVEWNADQAAQQIERATAAEAQVAAIRDLARDRWRYVNPDQCKIGPAELIAHLDRAGTVNSQVPPTSANAGSWAVTEAMVQAAINGAEQAGGFAHDSDRGERETLIRAALTAALAAPPAEASPSEGP